MKIRFSLNSTAFLQYGVAVLLALGSASVRANECSDRLKNYVQIKNDRLVENRFTVTRDLAEYHLIFNFNSTASLENVQKNLKPGSVWFDMGAGGAIALMEGLQKYPNISQGVAVAYQRPKNSISEPIRNERFLYLDGDYVENMALNGRLARWAYDTDLFTDVFGPISYSENLPQLFQIYFDLLKQDGVLYFNLMNQRNFVVNREGIVRTDTFKSVNRVVKNGRIQADGILAWLNSIPGIEVEGTTRMSSGGSGQIEESISYKVRKIAADVVVPNTLITEYYKAGSPPERSFILIENR